jgi:MFS transporter, putative metabolite:H+ symporter
LFAIVATAWLADQVDVALLVFLIGDLKNYFDLTPVQVGYLASMTFLGQLVGNLLIARSPICSGAGSRFRAP